MRVEFPVNVITQEAGLPIVRLAQFAVAVTVTVKAVALEALSKMTSSDDVGTDAPPAPPEVADQ